MPLGSYSNVMSRIQGDTKILSGMSTYVDVPENKVLVDDGVITPEGKEAGLTPSVLKKYPDHGADIRKKEKNKE